MVKVSISAYIRGENGVLLHEGNAWLLHLFGTSLLPAQRL